MQTLKYISEGANALLIGQPGTGKSHTAKAVAYHAVQQGLKAAYVETKADFAQYALSEARAREPQLQRLLAADLVVLDDLFLAKRISEVAAEFLQAPVHQRYKRRASIIVTSHRVIQDWGTYLGDMTMASTLAYGPRLQRGQVGAGRGLGVALAPDFTVRQNARQVPRLLLSTGEVDQRGRQNAVADDVDAAPMRACSSWRGLTGPTDSANLIQGRFQQTISSTWTSVWTAVLGVQVRALKF